MAKYTVKIIQQGMGYYKCVADDIYLFQSWLESSHKAYG